MIVARRSCQILSACWTPAWPRRLHAGAAVDAFPQQVGVPAVAAVLADHVAVRPAQRHLAPARADEDVLEREPGNGLPGHPLLGHQRGQVVLGLCRVEIVERGCRSVLPPVPARDLLAAETEPGTRSAPRRSDAGRVPVARALMVVQPVSPTALRSAR